MLNPCSIRVAVNPAAVIAGAEVAGKAAKMAGKTFVKGVNWKRRMIARAELEADNGKGKDLDGDGVVGGVGCGPRERERLRSLEQRRADPKRKILEQGR